MKKNILLLILVALTLPQCAKREQTQVRKKGYRLFAKGNIPAQPQPDTIVVGDLSTTGTDMTLTTTRGSTSLAKTATSRGKAFISAEEKSPATTPELDFEVQNVTHKTLYVACFTHIQKEPFTSWRWDKSAVYKIEPNQRVYINIDTIPDDRNREEIFGYLTVFDDKKEADDAIFELIDDEKKIDLDQVFQLKHKTIAIDTERYGFKKEILDFAIIHKDKKKHLPPELDFLLENNTGKTIYLTAFIYQIRDNARSVWTYDKTPVLKLKPGQTSIIDVDTTGAKRNRVYMSGFLGIFDEHEKEKAEKATLELLPPRNKISLGRLSRLEGQRVVIETEKYGAIGHINEFDLVDAQSPDRKKRSFDLTVRAFVDEENKGG